MKRLLKLKKKERNIKNELFKEYFTNHQNPNDMYKKLHDTGGKKNDDQVYLIKEVLNKMKKKCA